MQYQLLPSLTDDEYTRLKNDIKENGVLVPVEVDERGEILDGHHRVQAWQELRADGVAIDDYPRIVRHGFSEEEKQKHALRLNLERRQLNESQRAVIAARLANMTRGGDRPSNSGNNFESANLRIRNQSQISQPQAAEMLNVSERLVQTVKAVERQAPELIPQIERGEITVNEATHIIKDQQREQQIVKAARWLPEKPVVTYNTGDNEWYTPAMFIELARQVMGAIDLDPASCVAANEVVQAKKIYTIENDGLVQPWSGRVWLNPPYSSDLIGKFCDKVVAEYQQGNISAAMVLVNNSTETFWFRTLVQCASAIVFPHSRIRFWKPEGGPGAPTQGQAIVYIGPDYRRFLQIFQSVAWGAIVNE